MDVADRRNYPRYLELEPRKLTLIMAPNVRGHPRKRECEETLSLRCNLCSVKSGKDFHIVQKHSKRRAPLTWRSTGMLWVASVGHEDWYRSLLVSGWTPGDVSIEECRKGGGNVLGTNGDFLTSYILSNPRSWRFKFLRILLEMSLRYFSISVLFMSLHSLRRFSTMKS